MVTGPLLALFVTNSLLYIKSVFRCLDCCLVSFFVSLMLLIVLALRTSLLFVFRFVLFSCRLAFFLGSLSRSVFSCCCLFSYFLCDCVLCSLYARTRWSCFPVALSFSCSSGYVCCSPRASSCFLLILVAFLVPCYRCYASQSCSRCVYPRYHFPTLAFTLFSLSHLFCPLATLA